MRDVVVAAGSRYQFDKRNGLRIRNITQADDGEYTCRAEVDAEGRYDERKINVSVHSKSRSTRRSSSYGALLPTGSSLGRRRQLC